MRSYDIYTAVLDDGIRTPEEFERVSSGRVRSGELVLPPVAAGRLVGLEHLDVGLSREHLVPSVVRGE